MKANIELIVDNRIEWINKRMVVTQLQKDYIKFMMMDAIGEVMEQVNGADTENEKALHKQNVTNRYYFDCWKNDGVVETKDLLATSEEHAILKFEKEFEGYAFDIPYI